MNEEETVKHILKTTYGLEVSGVRNPKEATASSRVEILDCGTSGVFVLKRSDWYAGFAPDPRLALETVSRVHNMLKAEEVRLPAIIKTREGTLVTNIHGHELFVLMEFVEGKQISGRDEEYASAGEALAHFHVAGERLLKNDRTLERTIKKNVPVEKPFEDSTELYPKGLRETILSSHECSHPDVCTAVRENIAHIDDAINMIEKCLTRTTLTKGILHNDFNYANGLYDDDGNFRAFLDTEQLGVGPYVFDLGNTLASFYSKFSKNIPSTEHERKVKKFLRAYHSTNPLPMKEYPLIAASSQRWDVMRILRTLRRHHHENDRFPDLLPKISERLITRVKTIPTVFSFVNRETIDTLLG